MFKGKLLVPLENGKVKMVDKKWFTKSWTVSFPHKSTDLEKKKINQHFYQDASQFSKGWEFLEEFGAFSTKWTGSRRASTNAVNFQVFVPSNSFLNGRFRDYYFLFSIHKTILSCALVDARSNDVISRNKKLSDNMSASKCTVEEVSFDSISVCSSGSVKIFSFSKAFVVGSLNVFCKYDIRERLKKCKFSKCSCFYFQQRKYRYRFVSMRKWKRGDNMLVGIFRKCLVVWSYEKLTDAFLESTQKMSSAAVCFSILCNGIEGVSGNNSGLIVIWNIPKRTIKKTIITRGYVSSGIHEIDRKLIYGTGCSKLHFYDIGKGKDVFGFPANGSFRYVCSRRLGSEGTSTLIIASAQGELLIVDYETRKVVFHQPIEALFNSVLDFDLQRERRKYRYPFLGETIYNDQKNNTFYDVKIVLE